MPAQVTLKVMPRGCNSCPFYICETTWADEQSCLILEHNRVEYNINDNNDYKTKRRPECPMVFVER